MGIGRPRIGLYPFNFYSETVSLVIENCRTSRGKCLGMPAWSDTCYFSVCFTQVDSSPQKVCLKSPEWNIAVCRNRNYSSELKQVLIDAAQAFGTRNHEDSLGYFINKLHLCSLHCSAYLLNR